MSRNHRRPDPRAGCPMARAEDRHCVEGGRIRDAAEGRQADPTDRAEDRQGPPADRRISELASRQHGVVTRSQMLEAGVTRRQVEHRVHTGRLRLLHRGVYLVGVVPPPRAREMAAVLACGAGAVVSHRDAAALQGLHPPVPPTLPVRITVAGRDPGRRPGVRVHRVVLLHEEERDEVDGIPVTSPARTLLDLAAEGDDRGLERTLAEAYRRGLVDRDDLQILLVRHPRHRGVRSLRRLLEGPDGPALTRSKAEERFLTLVRCARLPAPEVNVVVGGCEVDFFWSAARLAVEIDGYEYHRIRTRFESDRRRDSHLLATEGIQVIRFTWRQIVAERDATLARLSMALGASRSR